MELSEAFYAIRTSTVGDSDNSYDRYQPRLRPDGSVNMAPEDGDSTHSARAREVIHWIRTLEDDGDLGAYLVAHGRRKMQCFADHVTVTLTDSRVIFVADKIKDPTKRVVGHIRYPWIETVAWHPNRGWSQRPRILLQMSEDFPVRHLGSWNHEIEVNFPKDYHPGELALELVKRICAHNLAHGAPQRAHDALRAMTVADLPDDPPEDDFCWFDIPANVDCPLGAEYVGDSPDPARWYVRVHGGDQTDDDSAAAKTESPSRPVRVATNSGAAEPLDDEPDGRLPLSHDVREALVVAAAAADELDARQISTAHLLLALLTDEKSRLTQLLSVSGADFDSVADRIKQSAGRD